MKPSRFATVLLRLAGWRFEGPVPTVPKYVCLTVPHTSNWDGVLLVLMLASKGIEMRWTIKNEWTKGLFGPLIRWLGGLGIDRSRSRNVVEQMIEQFRTRERFILGIPPEGTRGRTEYWKSGFYHIAHGADVPVVPGYLDFGRKVAGLGAPIYLTGDVRVDMDKLRAFYAEKKPVPHVPGDFGPIRLREEDAARP